MMKSNPTPTAAPQWERATYIDVAPRFSGPATILAITKLHGVTAQEAIAASLVHADDLFLDSPLERIEESPEVIRRIRKYSQPDQFETDRPTFTIPDPIGCQAVDLFQTLIPEATRKAIIEAFIEECSPIFVNSADEEEFRLDRRFLKKSIRRARRMDEKAETLSLDGRTIRLPVSTKKSDLKSIKRSLATLNQSAGLLEVHPTRFLGWLLRDDAKQFGEESGDWLRTWVEDVLAFDSQEEQGRVADAVAEEIQKRKLGAAAEEVAA